MLTRGIYGQTPIADPTKIGSPNRGFASLAIAEAEVDAGYIQRINLEFGRFAHRGDWKGDS